MTISDKDIVLTVRKHLADQIGPAKLSLLDTQVAMHWKHGELLITAASDFVLERIRSRHRLDLQRVLTAVCGHEAQLTFRVDEQFQPTLPSTTGDSHDNPTTLPIAAHAAAHTAPTINNAWRPAKRKYHSFDEFVVGPANRVAYTAAAEILTSRHLSLLVVHGATGSGKTHLLEAIWSQAKQTPGLKRMVYLSAEQFLNQFIEALQGSGLPNFRRKYRDLELFLLDDVHFLADKRNTVVELQHTIDSLLNAGHRVILSSDRPPREIAGLGDDLIGRLSAGVVLGVERPDPETRFGILQRLCVKQQLSLPEAMLRELANLLPADARMLAGAVNRLHAATSAFGHVPTMSQARELLSDLVFSSTKVVKLEEIATVICEEFGLAVEDLQSNSRAKGVSHPRMLAMFLARRHTRIPLGEIGRYFGKRSHTTVLSASQTVEDWVSAGDQVIGSRSKLSVAEALRRLESRLRIG